MAVLGSIFFKRTLKQFLECDDLGSSKGLALVEKMPGVRQGEIKLRFARKHRDEAHALASQLQLRLSEHRLERMDDEMRRLDDAANADGR